MARPSVGYGQINTTMVGGWLSLDPADDPPFWAVNLMRYKDVADYDDGRQTSISGREADDAYAPLGPLAAVGAVVALHGDVVEQPVGSPSWHRVGIVRYPSRAAFIGMQQREDFKQQHVHKEAGMDFTIVMSTAPRPDAVVDDRPNGSDLVMRVRRFATADRPAEKVVDGAVRLARLDTEGVIVGDDRTWDDVAFDAIAPGDADALAALCAPDGVDEIIAVVVRTEIDRLAETIRTAPHRHA